MTNPYLLPLRVTGEGVPGCTATRIPPAYCTRVEEGTGIMRRKVRKAKRLLEKIGAVNQPEAEVSMDDFSLPDTGYLMDNCLSSIDPPRPHNPGSPISRDVWTDGNFTALRTNNHLTIWSFYTDLKPAPA